MTETPLLGGQPVWLWTLWKEDRLIMGLHLLGQPAEPSKRVRGGRAFQIFLVVDHMLHIISPDSLSRLALIVGDSL